jgi:hypothetical protein
MFEYVHLLKKTPTALGAGQVMEYTLDAAAAGKPVLTVGCRGGSRKG